MKFKYFLVLTSLLVSFNTFASENDDLKVALQKYLPSKKAIAFKKIEKNSTGDMLAAWDEEFIYVAFKKDNKSDWKFIGHMYGDIDYAIIFKPNRAMNVELSEGGTDHSTTTSKWRMEGEELKIIGQDCKAYMNWNFGELITTVNFLSGKKVSTISSDKMKKKTTTCKFDVKKYRDQKLFDIGPQGVKEPECGPTF